MRFFGSGLSSENAELRPFDIRLRTARQIAMYKNIDDLEKGFVKTMCILATAGVGAEVYLAYSGTGLITTATVWNRTTRTAYRVYKTVSEGYNIYDKYIGSKIDYEGVAWNYANQSYSTGNWGIGNKDIISLAISGKKGLPVWGQAVLGTSGVFFQCTMNEGGAMSFTENSVIYSIGSGVVGASQPILGNSRFGNSLSSNVVFGTMQMGLNIYEKGSEWRK